MNVQTQQNQNKRFDKAFLGHAPAPPPPQPTFGPRTAAGLKLPSKKKKIVEELLLLFLFRRGKEGRRGGEGKGDLHSRKVMTK